MTARRPALVFFALSGFAALAACASRPVARHPVELTSTSTMRSGMVEVSPRAAAQAAPERDAYARPTAADAIDQAAEGALGPACVFPARCASAGPADAPDFAITLERTACAGSCPVYRVAIARDGTVTWRGARNVAVIGTATAELDRDRVRELAETVATSCFFEMPTDFRHPAEGAPSVITTVTLGGRTKTVRHEAGESSGRSAKHSCSAPAALLALEARIDDVAEASRWIDVASEQP